MNKKTNLSIKLINKILGDPGYKGFNDKRKYGRRIKLNHALDSMDRICLQNSLQMMFPENEIIVKNIFCGWANKTVTAIYAYNETTKKAVPTTNLWEVTINDGFCSYKYSIQGSSNVSIRDVADECCKILNGYMGEGKYVRP